MESTTQPFVLEHTFNVPAEELWQSLTDPEKMRKWYFDISGFKPEAGFEFQFSGGTKDKSYHHVCQVKDVIKNNKISYTWRYDGYPGESILKYELFEIGNKTKLKLTHSGLETFPQDNPDFSGQSFAKGWTFIIETSLKEFIEGK